MEADKVANETSTNPSSRFSEAAGAAARSTAGEVRETAGAMAQAARETGQEAKIRIADMVTSNPLMSIAIAAGVGYLLGAFTHR